MPRAIREPTTRCCAASSFLAASPEWITFRHRASLPRRQVFPEAGRGGRAMASASSCRGGHDAHQRSAERSWSPSKLPLKYNLAFGVSPYLDPSIRPVEPVGACARVRTQHCRLKPGGAKGPACKRKQGASDAAAFMGRIDEERKYRTVARIARCKTLNPAALYPYPISARSMKAAQSAAVTVLGSDNRFSRTA
jgi:hypothetical protein